MNKELSMETTMVLKLRRGDTTVVLGELYESVKDSYASEQDFLDKMALIVRTGKGYIIEQQEDEDAMADQVINELEAINNGESIHQDRVKQEEKGVDNAGVYAKVAFDALTFLEAQEMKGVLVRNFKVPEDTISITQKGDQISVEVEDCPVKKYISICRYYNVRNVSDAVSRGVNKMANSAVTGVDMVANSVVVPVAKTAVSTGSKLAGGLVGLCAKLAGMTIAEVSRTAKATARDIKNDGYIAEAKGEVTDGVQACRRAWNEKQAKRGIYGKGARIVDR